MHGLKFLLLSLIACTVAGVAMAEDDCAVPVDKRGVRDDRVDQPVLHVRISGVRNDDGQIMLTLYDDDPENFLESRRHIKVVHTPARADETYVCVHVPEFGGYALAIYHDEDADFELDKGFLGIPSEGFGFSNNPRIFLSPPDHEDSRFVAAELATEVEIALRY